MSDAPAPADPAAPVDLTVRPAAPADLPALVALHARARATYYPDGVPDDGTDWTAAWRGALERPDGRVLVGVRAGTTVALASFRPPGDDAAAGTVKLFQFHVDPGHWRAGIGSALHAACVSRWREAGLRTAVLDVHTGNARARAFYAAHGWTADPARPAWADDHHLHLRFDVPGGRADGE
ncbi:GNAT family N-acetyltransferase [Streptomyces sp. NPDC090306]|uniref:GNAT family N-acetyltransferase n=1 Tax=Streptomyces sp. NPDC090306 TaxID=3365961 RepID=UPI0037FDDAE7